MLLRVSYFWCVEYNKRPDQQSESRERKASDFRKVKVLDGSDHLDFSRLFGTLPKGIPRTESVSRPWVLTGFLAAVFLAGFFIRVLAVVIG